MKKKIYIKEALLLMTFAYAILLISACNNNQSTRDNTRDSKSVSEDHNKARFDDDKQKKDAQFLVNAAEFNLEQIQLGQLAQQKGRTTDVKELGKRMEDAHTKLQQDLTALASNKNISIPSSPTEDARNAHKNLNEKSQDDFDKAYTDRMVNKHKDAIDKFEKAANDSHDADVKNWARATLPNLRAHHDRSKECKEKLSDMALQERR